jgi:4-amino-4-deoxy-L-arabinose transferase-like glycosyltransferase
MCKIPLLDKEARYAEIARIMWDTNQWIMPQIDWNTFLGKTSILPGCLRKLLPFGVNE